MRMLTMMTACVGWMLWGADAGAAGGGETPVPGRIPAALVQERVAAANTAHPRLLATAAEFTALRARVAAGGLAGELAAGVLIQADALLDQPPVQREVLGRRLLSVSRTCLGRVNTLAMAYRLAGRPAHLRRAEQELLAAAAFSDWNPSHFLDVAEMTLALAIGYDWLYHELDPAARAAIRDAILTKGVRTSQHYQGWVRATNNWGQVCHGGIVAGALAVLEDEPALAQEIVLRAVNNVITATAVYAPAGAYPEGPMYWSYGTSYNVILIAVLESALGTDFGLTGVPGFDRTGEYLTLVTGPSGRTFNYADGGDGRSHEPIAHWFAQRFARPDWAAPDTALLRRRLASPQAKLGGRFEPLTLLWLRETPPSPPRAPRHWHGGGDVPVTIHRSAWDDPRAVFVGVKAGMAAANHGHMDAGSFVFEADGVRWAWDLGAEGYHAIEARGLKLWDRQQESDRWRIFRLNNLSHNTLVIDDRLHVASGEAKIVSFADEAEFPHTVVDLSAVYAGQAASVHRGVALLPGGQVLVRDALRGLKPGARVRWGMVTRATFAAGEGAVLTLADDGQRLGLHALHPAGAAWQEVNTAQPPAEWDSANPGTRMAACFADAPATGELDFAILLVPGAGPVPALPSPALLPPDQWGRSQ